MSRNQHRASASAVTVRAQPQCVLDSAPLTNAENACLTENGTNISQYMINAEEAYLRERKKLSSSGSSDVLLLRHKDVICQRLRVASNRFKQINTLLTQFKAQEMSVRRSILFAPTISMSEAVKQNHHAHKEFLCAQAEWNAICVLENYQTIIKEVDGLHAEYRKLLEHVRFAKRVGDDAIDAYRIADQEHQVAVLRTAAREVNRDLRVYGPDFHNEAPAAIRAFEDARRAEQVCARRRFQARTEMKARACELKLAEKAADHQRRYYKMRFLERFRLLKQAIKLERLWRARKLELNVPAAPLTVTAAHAPTVTRISP